MNETLQASKPARHPDRAPLNPDPERSPDCRSGRWHRGPAALCAVILLLAATGIAAAQDATLSSRAKERDTNGNGVIDRNEAGGPLAANFDEIDCNKSGTLDGAEIRGFFTGQECPKTAAATGGPAPSAAKTGASPRSGGRPPRPVRVDEVIVESQSQTDPVIGRLVARRAGSVAALISSAVRKMDVEVGDRVNKGDVIATLHRESLTALRDKFAAALATRRNMVKTAEAELAKKTREFERMKGLRRSSSFSRARFEDLESDVRTRRAVIEERRSLEREARADLKRFEIDLGNTEIRAPYDGTVIERHVEVGAYVGIGTRVVTLINDKEIEVEAEVPSDRITALREGVRVRLQLDNGTWLRGTVRAVIPNENPRTRTRPVRFIPEFTDASARLAVNQSVTVMVPIGKIRKVTTVHKDAVVHRGDNRSVYIARRGKAFPRQVRLGAAIGNRFIVLSGLQAGDKVITYGNEALPPGADVHVIANRLAPTETSRP